MRHKIITKKKNIWYSPIIAILLLAAIGWAGVVALRATAKQREVMQLRNQERQELAELKEQERHLSRKIEVLSTDDGVDQEIKRQYRVVRPEEQVVIVVPRDANDELPTPAGKNWWNAIRDFVGL